MQGTDEGFCHGAQAPAVLMCSASHQTVLCLGLQDAMSEAVGECACVPLADDNVSRLTRRGRGGVGRDVLRSVSGIQGIGKL